MIVLKRVFIRNFLSIKEADVALDNQGLVLVEGVNKDDPSALSNGAGKSSFVDAISWALFGVTARGSTGDAVVNLKAGRDTVVEVYLEVDGQPYVIMRGRKHKILKNRVMLRMGTVDLTLGTDKLTQERINNLLGCSVETFNAAIYMGQENMPDLPNMTDKALKQVLEEAMGLNKLDQAIDVANERIKDAENELSHLEAAYRVTKADLDYATHEITLLEEQLKECQSDIVQLRDEVKSMSMKHSEETDAMYKEILLIQHALKTASAPTVDPDAYLTERLVEYRKLKEAHKKMEAFNSDLTVQYADARSRHKSLAAKTGQCPTCKQNMPDGHVQQEDLDALAATAERIANEIKALRPKLEALVDRIEQHHEETTETVSKMRWELSSKPNAAQLAANEKAIQDKIQKVTADYKFRYDRMLDMLERKRNTATNTSNAISTKVMENVDRKELLDERNAKIEAVKERLDVLGKVKYALGRKGFRGEVLDQVTPYLNARTQHYLETLSDENITAVWSTVDENSDGDYTENFHIQVRHKSGVDRFANLSGGEKRKVRLACALALQDLVATRAVKPIKLFIADEIDDAIDAAGLELLMGLLEAKARDLGTVFIISHNDLADWCRNKITVTKQDGVSTFAIPT